MSVVERNKTGKMRHTKAKKEALNALKTIKKQCDNNDALRNCLLRYYNGCSFDKDPLPFNQALADSVNKDEIK